MITTAPNSSRKTGLRPQASSSGTASTILAGSAGALGFSRDNSPLSERIAYGFDITVLLVTERILSVFVKEANAV